MGNRKKGKVKFGLKRRKEVRDTTGDDNGLKAGSTEHHERVDTYLRSEEVSELVKVLQTTDLKDVPVLVGATVLGKVDLVKRFIREGCPLECSYQNGLTPFLWAVKLRHSELIELFVVKGADVTAEDDNGDNALIHTVRSTSWDESSALQYYRMHREYFDANYKNKVGNAVLHYCVRRHWLVFCRALFKDGVDIDCVNTKGITCLMMAASKGYENVVDEFIREKANVFAVDQRGCMALCYAISWSYQKNAERSNSSSNILLAAYSNSDRVQYVARKLSMLAKAGVDSSKTIATFISPVFSFFVRYVSGGLEMLLEKKVFDVINQALKNNIGNVDCVVSILGVLAELLNYCDCCVYKNNSNTAQDDLCQLFLDSQCCKMCMVTLKNSGPNQKSIAQATIPLLLLCPSSRSGRKWAQDHFAILQPLYQKFTEYSKIKYNIHGDETHLKLVKTRLKNFKSLLAKLNNGDNVAGKASVCPINSSVESFHPKVLEKEKVKQNVPNDGKKSGFKIAKKGSLDLTTVLGNYPPTVSKRKLQNESLVFEQDNVEVAKSLTTDEESDILEMQNLFPSDLACMLTTGESIDNFKETETSETEGSLQYQQNDRQKQLDDIMASIFSTSYSVTDLRCFEPSEYFEPFQKDISPTLDYLQALFDDVIAKYRKVWTYERFNNYPNRKTPDDEDEEVHLMKLKIVLSQLENYYLGMLTSEWEALMNVIRNKVWVDEESWNKVLIKIQEILAKNIDSVKDKVEKIEEEEMQLMLEKRRSQQTVELFFDQLKNSSSSASDTAGQDRLWEMHIRGMTDSFEEVSNQNMELSTIFFNKGYKCDSSSEIATMGSRSSQNNETAAVEETAEKRDYSRAVKCRKHICWSVEINNLKAMIKKSHIQYGDILLPNPLKCGRISLPFGDTGYFGSVEMGLDRHNIPMAVKHVKEAFPASINILSMLMVRLRHIQNKNLLSYYLSDGFEPVLATPLMDFNLGQFVLHLKINCDLELKAPDIIKEVISGLHFLHTQRPSIIHGNLKPSNIFVDATGTIKIAEFGISVALYRSKPAPPCSMIWWPGEVIKSYIEARRLTCTLEADVATTGMLIHFILSGGQHPFGQQVEEIVGNLLVGKWNLIPLDKYLEDLITWMLVTLPTNRPNAPSIVRHIHFWPMEKRWKFLLTCAGATPEGKANPEQIAFLHNYLDMKIKEKNVQGDWKNYIVCCFPNCKDSVKSFNHSMTGLLSFLRHSVLEREGLCGCLMAQTSMVLSAEPTIFIPHYCDLKKFFFGAFPVLALSVYRMLDGVQWTKAPLFQEFDEPPFDLS